MELFDEFSQIVKYRNCKSLEDASEVARAVITQSGMHPKEVLRWVLDELGGTPLYRLPEQFRSLTDAAFFTAAVNETLDCEFMAFRYPSKVADILVGLLLLHAPRELREHLRKLRSLRVADEPIAGALPRAGECRAETRAARKCAGAAKRSS